MCGFHCAEHCYSKNTALMFFSGYADPDVFVQEVFADTANKNIYYYILQDDLNTLISWAKAFNTEFDTNKCKIIQVSTLSNNSYFTYAMSSAPLEFVNHHLYLGILTSQIILATTS